MFFWPPAWQTRRTHAYKPIYEKLVFLWFSSELLNSTYWHPVSFAFFPLGQMDKSLGSLTKDCFLHVLRGLLASFRSLRRVTTAWAKAVHFSNNFMCGSTRHLTPAVHPCPRVRRDFLLKLVRALPPWRRILDPPSLSLHQGYTSLMLFFCK